MKSHWKLLGEGGLQAKIYKGKYQAKLAIPMGGRVQTKNLPWEAMGIFSGATQCMIRYSEEIYLIHFLYA